MPGGIVLSDMPRQRPIGPAVQFRNGLPTTPTYMVCRGYRPGKSHGTAQPSRHGLPHAFGLNARLRPFSSGYRVLPIPNRHGQSPKSPKSAAPATAVARRVGVTTVPEDHGFHHFAPRSTPSLAGDGFLRTTSALPESPRVRWERKSVRRDPGPTGPDDRGTSDVRSSTTRAAAPTPPANSAPRPACLDPGRGTCFPRPEIQPAPLGGGAPPDAGFLARANRLRPFPAHEPHRVVRKPCPTPGTASRYWKAGSTFPGSGLPIRRVVIKPKSPPIS